MSEDNFEIELPVSPCRQRIYTLCENLDRLDLISNMISSISNNGFQFDCIVNLSNISSLCRKMSISWRLLALVTRKGNLN